MKEGRIENAKQEAIKKLKRNKKKKEEERKRGTTKEGKKERYKCE